MASAIQEADRSTTWASAGKSAAATEATCHVGVAEPTRKDVEPLPPECRVPKVRCGGERDPAWVIFFVDDAISVEVQWRGDSARCKALTASLSDMYFQAMGERAKGGNPLLPWKKMTGWATVQEVLSLWLDTENMTVGLPQRKMEDLRQRLAMWLPERREATVQEVLRREAAQRGVRSLVRALLRIKASAVSKPASNRGIKRGRGRVG